MGTWRRRMVENMRQNAVCKWDAPHFESGTKVLAQRAISSLLAMPPRTLNKKN